MEAGRRRPRLCLRAEGAMSTSKDALKETRQRYPNRWNGDVRDLDSIADVTFHPLAAEPQVAPADRASLVR